MEHENQQNTAALAIPPMISQPTVEDPTIQGVDNVGMSCVFSLTKPANDYMRSQRAIADFTAYLKHNLPDVGAGNFSTDVNYNVAASLKERLELYGKRHFILSNNRVPDYLGQDPGLTGTPGMTSGILFRVNMEFFAHMYTDSLGLWQPSRSLSFDVYDRDWESAMMKFQECWNHALGELSATLALRVFEHLQSWLQDPTKTPEYGAVATYAPKFAQVLRLMNGQKLGSPLRGGL